MPGIDPSGPGAAHLDDMPQLIDLVHLACQTCDDRDLQRDVLGLMAGQIEHFAPKLGLAGGEEEAQQIAHALNGAASNVGAFALARAAEALEQAPGDGEARRRFAEEMVRTRVFIEGLLADRGS